MITLLRSTLTRFLREEDGASLVEYALLIGLIAVICIAAVTLIGNNVNTKLNNAANALQ